MNKKVSVGQSTPVSVQSSNLVIAYLEYVRSDVRALSPMGAHLLDMTIKQLIEDTSAARSPDGRKTV
jgi:hypothetical protein